MYTIHKVVEPDLFAKIEEINNHDEFYEEYKHWRDARPTDIQYAKKQPIRILTTEYRKAGTI